VLYLDQITLLFKNYKDFKKSTVTDDAINTDVDAIVDFEFRLAEKFLKNEYTRQLDYQSRSIKNLTALYDQIDFDSMLNALTQGVDSGDLMNVLRSTEIVVEQTDYLKALNDELKAIAADNGKLRTFYNYL
jgi:hypothetical protein